MKKGPGYIARMYGTGRRRFKARLADYLVQTPEPASKMGEHLLAGMDFEKLEKRVLTTLYHHASMDFAELERRTLAHPSCMACDMDFAAAAGATLAAVNADPRNHFGKHALRRFDND